MSKSNLSKKPSFFKSIRNRLQRKKIYLSTLEADFAALRVEHELLKRRAGI